MYAEKSMQVVRQAKQRSQAKCDTQAEVVRQT
jgi:hypothetical protein